MVKSASAVSGKRLVCAGATGVVGAALLVGSGVTGASAELTSPIALPGGADFTFTGAAAGDQSGKSVSIAGDVNGDSIDDFIIGAPDASNNDRVSSGSSYIVYGGGAASGAADLDSLNPSTTGLRIDGAAAGDASGTSVSGAGDVNDDGIDDVIVGAPDSEPNGTSSGSAYVIYGQANSAALNIDLADALDPASTGLKIIGGASNDRAGYSVSTAGDVNGDSISDIIVGAPTTSAGGPPLGSAFIIYGQPSNDAADIDLAVALQPASDGLRISSADWFSFMGGSVSGAGDVNGDTLDDVVIGAYGTNIGTGASYVVYGVATEDADNIDLATPLEPTSNGFRVEGAGEYSFSGMAVSGAGDVNGDGLDDVIIGEPGGGEDATTPGNAYVIYGTPKSDAQDFDLATTPLDPATTGLQIDGAVIGDSNGRAVSAAGDVNGDQFADVIVGAIHANDEAGSASVIYGTARKDAVNVDLATALNPATTGFQLDGATDGDSVGSSVSGAGDLNDDGLADVVVGAPGADVNGEGSGFTSVIYGAVAPEPTPAAQVPLKNCVKVPVALPKTSKTKLTKPRCKTNAGQAVKVTARAVSKRGDVRTFKLIKKKDGKTLIKTFKTKTRVTIKWKAPATDDYRKYKVKETYKIGKKA